MFRMTEDFLTAWGHEREATLKLLSNITDESLKQKISDGGRSLGRLAWHITQTIPEMMNRTGLKVSGPHETAPIPTSANEIKEAYAHASKSVAEQVKNNWNDESLNEEDDMYGMKWNRGTTLAILNSHQAHHRGQMTVLMRQAGLVVPGMYGPAKEEWASMGMDPLE
ncbi:MAG: DinB family protein [Ignavibacteriae bacterium]|nr:DinB family protein [Ignavibacteriota bacterium]